MARHSACACSSGAARRAASAPSTSSRAGRPTSSIPRRSRCAIEPAPRRRDGRRDGRMSGSASAPAPVDAEAAADAATIIGERRLAQVRWSLLFGNFVIGCGVMVPVGTLPDIARSLDVSVAVAGQLVAVAAVVMCFGAPLLAGWVGALDRRKLLAASLAWYAIGHALCALVPSFAALVPVRALTVLGADVFTPQAAAAMGTMTQPAERGGAITFIFLG